MANIAYLRVSTYDQDTSRQFEGEYDMFDKVYEDHASGTNLERPALQECLFALEEGDILHVHDISRLSRSVVDLATTVQGLLDRGVGVKFHKEGLEFCADMSEPMKAAVSEMMMTLLGAVAQFERKMISIRTKEGMAAKAKQGSKFGAASPVYGVKNKSKTRNRDEAVVRAQKYEQFLCVLMCTVECSTLREVAQYLTKANMSLPSGAEGEWKPAQVKRVLQKLGMYQDFINKKQEKLVA
jgi:DNA invertase Pin-like site-specific DNA recombinase